MTHCRDVVGYLYSHHEDGGINVVILLYHYTVS